VDRSPGVALVAWIRRAPSGRWQARWRDPGGRHRVKTFRLKADAERFLVSIEDSMHRGAYHDPNAGRETLGAFWGQIRSAAERTGRLSERTLIAYDEVWRLYLSPLADHPLNSISRADVDDVISSTNSPWRANDVAKVLRMILGRAVKAGKIGANPASGIELPKIEHREPRTLSPDELELLVDAMPDRWKAFVLLAAYSSLRFSELVALRVDRLELPRNRLRVEEKITEAGHLIAGTPKTERSRRTVTLPDFVTFELAEHLRRYPPGPNMFVFTMPRGGPVRRQTFYHRVWGPALQAAGLQGFRFGQLRHTGATMALEAGANPVLVAFRLGHTSTRMVEQHYAGRLDRADKEIAEALAARHGAARVRHAEGSGAGEPGAHPS
jgi:integrase